MNIPTIKLNEAAEINPRLNARPAADAPVSFIRMADVDAEGGTTTRGYARQFGEVSNGYTQFADGDLLVAKITPCFENGKIAQAKIEHSYGTGSTEFHVIRPDRSRFDDRFLLRFLRQPYVRIAGERRMTGSAGQRRVPEAYLADLPVPLLPLEEQRRIAYTLDSVDTLRAMRRETIALLEDLTQSIFIEMFGDPTTNPKRWEVESLGELARVIRGASPRPKGDPKYFDGPIPWLMISDVTRSPGDTVTKIREGVTAAGRDKSVYLKAGTLILTNSATVGLPKFLGIDACIHDGFLAILNISSNIDPMYLYQFFKQNREKISSLAPEGTQKNLNTGIAKALSIPVPPLAIQQVFRRSIEQINLLRSAHQAHLAELDTLFASVQHRAFRGELWADSPAA